MKNLFVILLIILFLLISACSSTGDETDKGDENELGTGNQVALGSLGESCTSRRDCEEGLACFAQVCTNQSSAEETGDDTDEEIGDDTDEETGDDTDEENDDDTDEENDDDTEEDNDDETSDQALDPRGGAGESCTSRRDCEEGLACFAQVCTNQRNDEENSDDTDVQVSDPRGGAGESCTSRRDCQEGLGCFGNVCLVEPGIEADAGSTSDPVTPSASTRSELGESCRARNDCAEGLICVNATCVDNNVDIQIEAKSCVFVECTEHADCCADFEPSVSQTSCDSYRETCDSDPVTYEAYCTAYESSCVCHRTCVDSRCDTPLNFNCTEDAHCEYETLTPYCVNYQCVECTGNEQCTLEGDVCIDNVCQLPPPPCVNNEQCPLMFACQEGDCVEVGCATDRECFFYTGFDRSVCSSEKKCTIPCEVDGDCAAQDIVATDGRSRDPFWVCQEGTCVFIGCQTDEECRVYLGVENLMSSGTMARCE